MSEWLSSNNRIPNNSFTVASHVHWGMFFNWKFSMEKTHSVPRQQRQLHQNPAKPHETARVNQASKQTEPSQGNRGRGKTRRRDCRLFCTWHVHLYNSAHQGREPIYTNQLIDFTLICHHKSIPMGIFSGNFCETSFLHEQKNTPSKRVKIISNFKVCVKLWVSEMLQKLILKCKFHIKLVQQISKFFHRVPVWLNV